MIKYKPGWTGFDYMVQIKGSVFPHAARVAIPCGLLSALLKWLEQKGVFRDIGGLEAIHSTGAFSGFTFLVGFLIVFRTSQAYARFWSAVFDTHQMCAQWFDAASSAIAFSRNSTASCEALTSFEHTMIRLFSMLTASALQDLCDDDVVRFEGFETLDPAGIDRYSIITLDDSQCKVELVYQWIVQLLTDSCQSGVICVAPPIATRAFQQLADGMVRFHDAMKIAWIPFPFPYAQATVALLLMHWLVTPVVMVAWTSSPMTAGVFTFMPVFTLWGMNCIATEIEGPFSGQANDIDLVELQKRMNTHLLLLLDPHTTVTPTLSSSRDPADARAMSNYLVSERGKVHTMALEAKGAERWMSSIAGRPEEKATQPQSSNSPQRRQSWDFVHVDGKEKQAVIASGGDAEVVAPNISFGDKHNTRRLSLAELKANEGQEGAEHQGLNIRGFLQKRHAGPAESGGALKAQGILPDGEPSSPGFNVPFPHSPRQKDVEFQSTDDRTLTSIAVFSDDHDYAESSNRSDESPNFLREERSGSAPSDRRERQNYVQRAEFTHGRAAVPSLGSAASQGNAVAPLTHNDSSERAANRVAASQGQRGWDVYDDAIVDYQDHSSPVCPHTNPDRDGRQSGAALS